MKYALMILLACTSAVAGTVERTVSASPDGEVRIEVHTGVINVAGWDRDEVSVSGTVPSASHMELDSDDGDVEIEIEPGGKRGGGRSELDIRMPRTASISIECLEGDVRIEDLRGEVEVEAVNGSVTIFAPARSIDVQAITGRVEIRADRTNGEIDVETIAGDVSIVAGGGDVGVEAVSGRVHVSGGALSDVSLETTSGDITLDADFESGGDVDLATYSGTLRFVVAQDISARFEFTTFNGSIKTDFGTVPTKAGDRMPGQELEFSTGGSVDVAAETFSGNIELRKRR